MEYIFYFFMWNLRKLFMQKHHFEKLSKTSIGFKIKLFNFFKYFQHSFQIFLFPKLDIHHEQFCPFLNSIFQLIYFQMKRVIQFYWYFKLAQVWLLKIQSFISEKFKAQLSGAENYKADQRTTALSGTQQDIWHKGDLYPNKKTLLTW